MLVLTRERGEVIEIRRGNDLIRISVQEIRHGSKVRIGIQAPDDFEIERPDMKRGRDGRRIENGQGNGG